MKEIARTKTADAALISLSAALISICAWIQVPMSVPFTMQTFAVFAVAAILGFKRGSLATAIYILIGAVGIPVFSGFRSGIGALLGSTGGYIVGFLLSAMIIGFAVDKFGRKVSVMAISMVIGLAACYLFGSLWFMYVYTRNTGSIGFAGVVMTCVVPFIVPDLAKCAFAILITTRIGKFIK